MFGIGGSVLSSPMLAEFTTLTTIQAFATPLSTAFFTSASGSLVYCRKKMIHYRIAMLSLCSAIPVSLIVTSFTQYVNADLLLIGKTFLLLYIGLQTLFAKFFPLEGAGGPVRDDVGLCLFTGAISGIIGGLFAIGGGIVFVPLFNLLHRMKFKHAVATSLFGVIFVAFFNAIYHYYLGNIHVQTAIILAIFALPMSVLGARVSSGLKTTVLDKLFGVSVVLFAVYFIISNIV